MVSGTASVWERGQPVSSARLRRTPSETGQPCPETSELQEAAMEFTVTKAAVDAAVAIGAAILGAIATYFLTIKIERRKQAIEKAKSAHDACLHLQEILANWMNEITDATREEKSADAVRQR